MEMDEGCGGCVESTLCNRSKYSSTVHHSEIFCTQGTMRTALTLLQQQHSLPFQQLSDIPVDPHGSLIAEPLRSVLTNFWSRVSPASLLPSPNLQTIWMEDTQWNAIPDTAKAPHATPCAVRMSRSPSPMEPTSLWYPYSYHEVPPGDDDGERSRSLVWWNAAYLKDIGEQNRDPIQTFPQMMCTSLKRFPLLSLCGGRLSQTYLTATTTTPATAVRMSRCWVSEAEMEVLDWKARPGATCITAKGEQNKKPVVYYNASDVMALIPFADYFIRDTRCFNIRTGMSCRTPLTLRIQRHLSEVGLQHVVTTTTSGIGVGTQQDWIDVSSGKCFPIPDASPFCCQFASLGPMEPLYVAEQTTNPLLAHHILSNMRRRLESKRLQAYRDRK